jgi:L-fuculose-phosphate aldolase
MASPVKTDEGYIGVKFRTVYERHEPPQDPVVEELIAWCRRFAGLGLVGKAMGNLSARTTRGFIITPTGTDPRTITDRQFVEVLGVDLKRLELRVAGPSEPSSESMVHEAIYRARPDVRAIFHGHSDQLLAVAESLGIPVTKREQPYGTPALVQEVVNILTGNDVFVMRGHGFVALGADCATAGRRVGEMLGRL